MSTALNIEVSWVEDEEDEDFIGPFPRDEDEASLEEAPRAQGYSQGGICNMKMKEILERSPSELIRANNCGDLTSDTLCESSVRMCNPALASNIGREGSSVQMVRQASSPTSSSCNGKYVVDNDERDKSGWTVDTNDSDSVEEKPHSQDEVSNVAQLTILGLDELLRLDDAGSSVAEDVGGSSFDLLSNDTDQANGDALELLSNHTDPTRPVLSPVQSFDEEDGPWLEANPREPRARVSKPVTSIEVVYQDPVQENDIGESGKRSNCWPAPRKPRVSRSLYR